MLVLDQFFASRYLQHHRRFKDAAERYYQAANMLPNKLSLVHRIELTHKVGAMPPRHGRGSLVIPRPLCLNDTVSPVIPPSQSSVLPLND